MTALLLSVTGTPEGRVVRQVDVVDRTRGRVPTLKPDIKPGDTVRAEEWIAAGVRLREQLVEHGYLWASVAADTSSDRGGVRITFRVDRGVPARVAGWSITEGDSATDVRFRLPGRRARFQPATVRQAVESGRRWYESQGYPFAQVRCVSLRDSVPFVFPTLSVSTGPKVWLGFVEFAGTPGTRPLLLARLSRFSPGWYSRTKLAAWQRGLHGSGLVRVESTAIVQRDTSLGVRFWVVAEKSNRAAASAGYDPAVRRLTGLASLRVTNLFDTGRRLEAGWHSTYARTGYALSYTEPWVLGTGIDLTGSMRHETEDTVVSGTNIELTAAAVTRPGTVVLLEAGLDFVTHATASLDARTVWAGTGVRIDTRDYPANPRSGLALSVGTRAGTRTADTAGNGLVSRTEAGLGGAVALSSRLVFASDLAGRIVYSVARLSRTELYDLGGARSVRGLRENEFASDRTVVLRAELRYLPDRQSRIYPFFDCGAFVHQGRWRFISGCGAGVRAATRAGVLGLDYGVAVGEHPLQGKVHLSFETGF